MSTLTSIWREIRKSIIPFKWEQRYVALLHYRYYQRMRSNSGEHSFQPFDDHRCIFIHVPKNGGISVANGLFGVNRMMGGHFSVDFYETIFGTDFANYFKFAISRNPWDRLVSAYHFLKSGGLYHGDATWAVRHLAGFHSFHDFVDNWLDSSNLRKGIHFIPQYEFICDAHGRIAVDYVGRLEALDEAYAHISQRLNLHHRPLPHTNSSKRRTDYRTYYGDKQAEKVAAVYKRDIETFGYTFDPP
ncbi:MAG: sulfotransferase family 2 domain-containing protein [Verrucomicrobiae bacterium]|nr:sulfotransferase family 2 domain-containing protein [Verrucomicrobiae bacterium]